MFEQSDRAVGHRRDAAASSDSDCDSVYIVDDKPRVEAMPAATHRVISAFEDSGPTVRPPRAHSNRELSPDSADRAPAAPDVLLERLGSGSQLRVVGRRKRVRHSGMAAAASADQPGAAAVAASAAKKSSSSRAKNSVRAAGATERQMRIREQEMQKLLKRALADQRKASRPGECDKHMVIDCDRGLMETELGDAVRSLAEIAHVGCDFSENAMLNSIVFKRRRTEFDIDAASGAEQDVIKHITLTPEGVAVVLSANDFFALVKSFVDERRGIVLGNGSALPLKDYAMRVQETFSLQPTIIVIGCDSYFSSRKAKTSKSVTAKRSKSRSADASDVTRLDVEECCVDLQLKSNISVIHCGSIAEAAQTVMHLNKAIAEAPYKREKLAALAAVDDDGRMTVAKLSKEGGAGLAMTWRKMLQEFRNVSPEVAEAIVDAYPSPKALFEAYKSCGSEAKAASLLEDLQVRRGTGALQTIRRVGKELSRRVYQLFFLTDPTVVIA